MASIPPFSPEPYQPIPHQTHAESPDAATSVELRPESVSAHFSLFKKALTLYQTIELPEKPVVFSTSVFSDGWGDLFSCLNAVKLFRAQHPNAPYRILIYNHNPNPMPPIAYEQFLVDPTYVASAMRPDYADSDYEDAFTKAFPTLDFTQVMHYFVPVPSKNQLPDASLCSVVLHEYGEHLKNHPATALHWSSHQAMGVSPSELGIFFPRVTVPDRFTDTRLTDLFALQPTVYTHYATNLPTFIKAICRSSSDLHVVTRDCKFLNFDWVVPLGITEVFLNNERVFTAPPTTPPTPSKALYLYNYFPMIQSDLFRCIHLSSSPIGITGNCSFSEALVISDKLPFYDTKVVYPPRYSWDRDLSTYRFWQSVVTLADRLVIGDDVSKKAFIHYLLTGEGLTPETLPCFQAYWQTVRNHILTHCDVAPYLSGLLHRAACLHEHPDLKDAEAAIARQLHQGTLTEEEAVSALRQKLKPYYPSML